jgi:hypothetical protein
MSRWQLHVPFRDRSEPLDADAFTDLPGYLDPADRGVARNVLIGARLRGARAVGDLLDELAGASPRGAVSCLMRRGRGWSADDRGGRRRGTLPAGQRCRSAAGGQGVALAAMPRGWLQSGSAR